MSDTHATGLRLGVGGHMSPRDPIDGKGGSETASPLWRRPPLSWAIL
jgi:hypothetical protein